MHRAHAVSFSVAITLLSLFAAPGSAGDAGDALDSMELAVDLYHMAYYEEAHTILERIDTTLLDVHGRTLWHSYAPRIREAAGHRQRGARSLDDARTAIGEGRYGAARRQLAEVLLSHEAPLATKESAQSHFETIGRASVQHPINVREPVDDAAGAPIDYRAIARQLVGEGLASLGHGQLHEAQSLFRMAAWHAPQAPRRALIVDPAVGVAFEAKAGSEFERLSVGEIHSVHVAAVVRNVTMNVNLSLGSLVSLDTFRFSDPGGAGSAGGWVQIPSINRTQIKTTVTAPAQEIALESGRPITYLVLVRPDP